MFTNRLAIAFGAGMLLAVSVQAADLGASIEAGTTGVGAHLVSPLSPSFNVRAGVNYLHYNTDRTAGTVNYDVKLKLQTVDVLADWYVSPGSGFRITGGAVFNNSKFDAYALPNAGGSYNINGRQYSVAQVGTLNGKIDFRKAAPYIGIGWGNAMSSNGKWSFTSDLGATFQGKPNVRLTNTGCSALAALCTVLANDIAVEQAKLSDDVDSMRIYPVLRVGLNYRF